MNRTDLLGRQEVSRFFMFMGVWVGVVCVWSLWLGKTGIMASFVFGVAGSIGYVVHLYRQMVTTLDRPAERIETSMRSGWIIRLTAASILLIISLKVEEMSFLAALFGLFSFQISLFGYAILISAQRVFYSE